MSTNLLARAHAQDPGTVRPPTSRRRLLPAIALVLGLLLVVGATPVDAVVQRPAHTLSQAGPAFGSAAWRVIRAAKRHLGARYVHGSTGPSSFDCSGLVFRVFKDAGLASRIGGFKSAAGYAAAFERRGRTSRRHGRPGDLVSYGHGAHLGIYIGHGKVISALLSGVKIHRLRAIHPGFTEFLHTRLSLQPRVHYGARVGLRKAPLRALPRQHSRVVAHVHRGSTLKVIGMRKRHGNVWVHVRLAGGRLGWVRATFTRLASA